MALSVPISLSLSYVPLSCGFLISLYLYIRTPVSFPKDFLLFPLLYLWRGVTLLANGLPLYPLRDIYDKTGYLSFAAMRIDERKTNIVLVLLGVVSSLVSSLGVLALLPGVLRTGWIYSSCIGTCDLTVKKTTEIHAIILTDRDRNHFLNGPKVTHGKPIRLEPGKYTYHSYAGSVLRLRKEDVELGKGWVGDYEERRFYDFTSFVGLYDHKMHSGAVFSIIALLFLTLGLFYRRAYLWAVPLPTIALLLSGAKGYTLVFLILTTSLLYARFRLLHLLPHFLLWILPTSLTVLLHSSLKDGFLWSLKIRLNFWRIGAQNVKPLFGVGYDNVSSLLQPFYERGVIDNTAHLHSSYLNSLVETGVLGFLLTIGILIYFTIKFYFRWKRSRGYVATLSLATSLAIGLIGMVGLIETNYDTAIVNILLGFLMGISEAAYRSSFRT